MVDDKIRRMSEEALTRLSDELQAGHSDALKTYLAAQARFHRYSWGNVLLINSQRPTATRVAGYHAWHELGRSVKHGEKGIMIYAPIRMKDPAPPAATREEKPRDASQLSGFRVAYVFDVDQTQGRPLPAFATTTGDPREYTDKLKAIVAKQGIALDYDQTIAPAHGVSTGGRIRLLPDLSPAEEFSVLSHELAHEMIHHRRDGTHFPITVRETQAEAVSFVVCRAVGLETHSAAADYIKLYNGDKNTLAESLSAIHDTSTRILHDLLPEERQRPTPSPTPETRAEDREPSDRAQAAEPPRPPGPHTPAERDSPSLDR